MKKKLLLADDSITIQKVIAITFSSDDYALTVVDNGDVALEKARSEKPDLVLADVFMPGKNGYELCAAIKQDPQLAGVPVLLLTGTFEPFDEAKARAVGAERWIAKPFESQSLIDCVETLLSGAAKGAAPKPAAEPPPAIAAPAPASAPRPATSAPPPVVAAPVAAVVPAPAAPAPSVASDDLWGDAGSLKADFEEFGGTTGDADLLAADGSSDSELWGAVSLEELPAEGAGALPELGEDVWGAVEEQAPMNAAATDSAISDQDIWGGFDSEALADDTAALSAATDGGEEGALSMDDVEILEEEDLNLDITPPVAVEMPETMELEVPGFDAEPSGVSIDWEEPASAVAAPQLKASAPPMPTLEDEFSAPAQAAVAPRVPQQQSSPAPIEAQVAALSEADLERIVEKIAGAVIERLAGSVLEKIAWDVVPDLAESLIKDEIQKIKEAV